MQPFKVFLRLFYLLSGFFYIYPPKDAKGDRKDNTKGETISPKTPKTTTTTVPPTTSISSATTTSVTVCRPSTLSTTQAPVATTTSTVITPSETDPRVGFVYHLSKSELEVELNKVGLDIEGNVQELRKRLVAYIRSQRTPIETSEQALGYAGLPPTTNFPPSSIFQPFSTQVFSQPMTHAQSSFSHGHDHGGIFQELVAFREMLGLPPSANVEQVKRSLAEMVIKSKRTDYKPTTEQPSFVTQKEPLTASQPTPFHDAAPRRSDPYQNNELYLPVSVPNIVPDPQYSSDQTRFNNFDHTNMNNTTHQAMNENLHCSLAQTCNTVRKWNLRYDGDKDAISFLERLTELVEAYDVDKNCLLKALPEVFKGQALLWYRNNKEFWNTYDDFLEAFQQHFLPQGYHRRLGDEIKRRSQGGTEKFRNFVTAITTLMRRHGGYSQNEQLNQIYTNMHPEYKLTIRRESFNSITEFIQLAESYESYLHERANYRPPPNPSQVLIPETAFDPKANHPKLSGVDLYEPKIGSNETRYKPFTRTNFDNKNSSNQFNNHYNLVETKKTPQKEAGVHNLPHYGGNQTQAQSQRVTTTNEIVSCWNCDKTGHKFHQCTQPKVIKCFNCKKVGVRTVHCDCRSGNGRRGQGAGGTLSLRSEPRNSPPQTTHPRDRN